MNGDWTYGGVNCSDPESGQSTTTSCESGCPYPFADCGPLYDLTAEGGWRYQYEVAGYRGVGPGRVGVGVGVVAWPRKDSGCLSAAPPWTNSLP